MLRKYTTLTEIEFRIRVDVGESLVPVPTCHLKCRSIDPKNDLDQVCLNLLKFSLFLDTDLGLISLKTIALWDYRQLFSSSSRGGVRVLAVIILT